jgi:hypothetical protein
MRIFCSFIFLFIILSFQVEAQVNGVKFPGLTGETLENKKINIPKTTLGKYTLVGLAQSKKAEDDLNTWLKPVFETFLMKTTGLFAAFNYDVNVYFVPVFTGLKTAAAGPARKKAIKNIDPRLHSNILFFKGNFKEYEETLKIEEKDLPYFFVLNQEGKVVYSTSGRYSDQKMQEVEAAIE